MKISRTGTFYYINSDNDGLFFRFVLFKIDPFVGSHYVVKFGARPIFHRDFMDDTKWIIEE